MEEREIVELYWNRDEAAIRETEQRYGSYLFRIAYNILAVWQDSEECLSDTYLRAWNAIPPKRPENLKLFLGRITRNLALDRRKGEMTEKRGGGQQALVLEELEECVSGGTSPQEQLEEKLLGELISTFLRQQPQLTRRCFVLRYWYLEPMPVIAQELGLTVGGTKSLLHRTRKKLKAYLEKEGIVV